MDTSDARIELAVKELPPDVKRRLAAIIRGSKIGEPRTKALFDALLDLSARGTRH